MKSFLIQKIQFSTESRNVKCCGILNMGNLSLNTSLRIDFGQLNVILNKISRSLDSDRLYDCLKEEETAEGTFYSMNLEDQEILPISLVELNQEPQYGLRISA
jgi:hypothetical protein